MTLEQWRQLRQRTVCKKQRAFLDRLIQRLSDGTDPEERLNKALQILNRPESDVPPCPGDELS